VIYRGRARSAREIEAPVPGSEVIDKGRTRRTASETPRERAHGRLRPTVCQSSFPRRSVGGSVRARGRARIAAAALRAPASRVAAEPVSAGGGGGSGCLVTMRSGESAGRGADPERAATEAVRSARAKIRRLGHARGSAQGSREPHPREHPSEAPGAPFAHVLQRRAASTRDQW